MDSTINIRALLSVKRLVAAARQLLLADGGIPRIVTARTLFHGTLQDHTKSIDRLGIWPSAGSFVEEMYGGDVDADDMPELVFLADRQGIEKAVTAMMFQIYKKLGKGWVSDVTEQDVRNHGALCIIREVGDGDFSHRSDDDDESAEHPVTVEPGDYYDESSVGVDTILTGPALLRYIKRFGIDIDRDNLKEARDELTKLAVRHHGDKPPQSLRDKIQELNPTDLRQSLRYYREKYAESELVRSAATDPFRNLKQDTQDAMQHVEQMDENVPDYMWHITKNPRMSLSDVLSYDDVSSWGEWRAGELKGLGPDELFAEMRGFRGLKWAETARTWLQEGFPAIVITETPEYVGISDGRGRVSLAYGLGMESIPAVVMKADTLPHQAKSALLAASAPRIRKDQGDGFRIDTDFGYIQYRPVDGDNEVWWIESKAKGGGAKLMDLMIEHSPCESVSWGATSQAGQAFRDKWHKQHPDIQDATDGERVPFDGQFDPYESEGSVGSQQVVATEAQDPAVILSKLKNLSGLRAKLAYVRSALPRLGEGSSRIVFDFDKGRVIKVAKNVKGAAQNRTEIDTSNLYSRVVTEVSAYDESDEDAWIVSEKARRATAADWPVLAGVGWKTAQGYLTAEGARHQNRPYAKQPEELHENEFLGSIVSLMADYDMPVGDMLRPSSWGVVNHGGKDHLVLVDSGLTHDIFQEHYK